MDTEAFESTIRTFESSLQMVLLFCLKSYTACRVKEVSSSEFLVMVSAGQHGMTEVGRYAGNPTYLPGVCLSNGLSANNFKDT